VGGNQGQPARFFVPGLFPVAGEGFFEAGEGSFGGDGVLGWGALQPAEDEAGGDFQHVGEGGLTPREAGGPEAALVAGELIRKR